MLRYLLDEHISNQVAEQMKRRKTAVDVRSIHDWESGAYLGAPDLEILAKAGQQHLTLVTYDQRTLWKHASDFMESGREHGGVIFVDEQTIPPNDIGGLMRSLLWLWEIRAKESWQNRLIFLTPASAVQSETALRSPSPRQRRHRSKRAGSG